MTQPIERPAAGVLPVVGWWRMPFQKIHTRHVTCPCTCKCTWTCHVHVINFVRAQWTGQPWCVDSAAVTVGHLQLNRTHNTVWSVLRHCLCVLLHGTYTDYVQYTVQLKLIVAQAPSATSRLFPPSAHASRLASSYVAVQRDVWPSPHHPSSRLASSSHAYC